MNIIILLGALITAVSMIPVVRQLRDHPRGLTILFFAEMWERFSYYGMRALLIFYLTQHFLFDDKDATARYTTYTTLVTLLPMVGAVIADRILGLRKAIAFGALLLVAGHLTMALEGNPAHNVLRWQGQSYDFQSQGRGSTRDVHLMVGGQPYGFVSQPNGDLKVLGLPPGAPVPEVLPKGAYQISVVGRDALHANLLFVALSLIVMGTSFMRATPMVSKLYERTDPRRDAGFTLFYYGVNLGAFWAGVLCGWLGETLGWWAGFGAAAVGMSAGYLVFIFGKPLLDGKGESPDPEKLARPVIGPINREHLIYLGGVLGVVVVSFLIRSSGVVGWALALVSVTALSYLGFYMARSCTPVERRRIALAFVLMLGSMVFFTLFEQAGSSMNLFADRNTSLDLMGSPIALPVLGHTLFLGSKAMLEAAHLAPGQAWFIDMGLTASQTQSINPAFILIFAPIFAAIWAFMGRRGVEPPVMIKFAIALMQVGAGFLFLVWGAQFADAAFKVPLFFLVGAYLLHTTGELCLSPVGLSAVSRLSPPAIVATLLAMWTLAGSWARFIGGKIAAMASSASVGGRVLDPHASLQAAVEVFTWIGVAGIGVGVLFLGLAPLVRNWGIEPDEAG